jgi:hypothetical protein
MWYKNQKSVLDKTPCSKTPGIEIHYFSNSLRICKYVDKYKLFGKELPVNLRKRAGVPMAAGSQFHFCRIKNTLIGSSEVPLRGI